MKFNEIGAKILTHDQREGFLPVTEFYPNKKFILGAKYHFVVIEERPRMILSTTNSFLIQGLIEGLVPEIREGKVRVMSVARRIGIRSKIAVASTSDEIDAVGVCIGKAANRVKALIEMLNNERVDIVPYHSDLKIFINNAMGVKVTEISFAGDVARVSVPSHQYQAALGGGGLNASLASRLTGIKIMVEVDEK